MRIYRPVRAAWVDRQPPASVWERGLENELGFWQNELPGRIREMESYRRRMDPDAEVTDPLLRELLHRIEAEVVSVLDVGAGPLTSVGKRYAGKKLQVTAVDPLAEDYARFMREREINPPVWPVQCRGEDLLGAFAPETFDIAFARNSLDHSVDPILVVQNMVELVKPGGAVLLEHLMREGERTAYRGLHQWNFDLEGDDLIVQRSRGERANLTRLLDGRVRSQSASRGGWILCTMTKVEHTRPQSPAPPST